MTERKLPLLHRKDCFPHYVHLASPLSDITKGGMPERVVWTEAANETFITLKKRLWDKPVLGLPDLDRPFVLRTDASEIGFGTGMSGCSVGCSEIRPISLWSGDYFADRSSGAEIFKYGKIRKQPRHEMGLEIASVSIPYPGHTWKGKCRRRFIEQMMTHVWEGGVLDRVCVLRSLLQENTFRQSAVPKHLYVRIYIYIDLYV